MSTLNGHTRRFVDLFLENLDASKEKEEDIDAYRTYDVKPQRIVAGYC